jgi:hypothetical protein
MASKEVQSAKLHLTQQGKKLQSLFGTMNPTEDRLKEWKNGLDEVQTNLKKFDATYKDQPVIKNEVTAERDSLSRYVTQCIATYEEKAKVKYKFEYKEAKLADEPPVTDKQPDGTKKTDQAATPSTTPTSGTSESQKQGDADGKALIPKATNAGAATGNLINDGVNAVKDMFDGKDDKSKAAPSTPASAAESQDDKNKGKGNGEKDKKPFDWGTLIGGLLGAGGGWLAGSVFGSGTFGKIAAVCLAIGGFFMGQKFSGKINGLLGRSDSSKPNEDDKKKEKQLELEKGKTPEEIERLREKTAADEAKAVQEKLKRDLAEHQQIYDAYQKEAAELKAMSAENHSQISATYGDAGSSFSPPAPKRHSFFQRG